MFLLSCDCQCSMSLSHGAVHTVVSDCGISWSYSLAFFWSASECSSHTKQTRFSGHKHWQDKS